MEIFKVIGVGILTCIVAIILKQIKPEFFIIIILSGSIIIFLMIVNQLKFIFEYVLTIFNKTKLDYSLFVSVLKIVGVGFITEFANSICVDSGISGIGDKILIAGKIIILTLALPILTNLLNIIIELL